MGDPFVERLRRGLEPDFAVEGPLGEPSGMGIVVRARDVALDCPVAIKTIRPELATAVAVERFLREARTLASFAHPNIVRINRYGTTLDGIPYFVMELVEGETLSRRLERGPLPYEEAVRIGRDILSALEAMHGRGIIHRDIKPANIFLLPGRGLLADFGIVKDLQSRGDAITRRGEAPGTPLYASPEQLAGAEVGPATDLWSLAAVLYEAFTGRVWSTSNPIEEPVAGDWSGVPGRVRRALLRGLAFAPADRWADAAAFQRALTLQLPPWYRAAVAAAAVTLLVLVLWPPGPPPLLPMPTVALGQFSPADPGARLREVAFEVLHNAEGVTLAPLTDDVAPVATAVPKAQYEVRGLVEREAGGRLRVVLEVGNRVVERTGDPNEFEWDLGQKVALAILEVVKPNAFIAPACKPQSVDAYNAFMRGQEAFRRDDWDSAIGHLREAVTLDPEYCLAEVRLWLVQRWSRTPTTVDLGRLLVRHGGSLRKADSLMIAAELAPTRERRWALYADAVAKDPFGAVARLQYGGDLTHRGPLDGIPLDSGVTILREAREREPQLASIHDQLMWALTRLGYRDSARAALLQLNANARALRDVDPSVFDLIWRMRFLPIDSVLPRLGAAGEGARAQIMQRVRLALSFDLAPYQAVIGGQLAAALDVSASMRAHGRIAGGLAYMALGRTAAGLTLLDSAARMATPHSSVLVRQVAQWRALAGPLGIVGVPEGDVAAARATLERLTSDSIVGGGASWTLALDAWGRGDTTAARAQAARIPPRDSALRAIATAIDTGGRDPERALALTDPWRGVREEASRPGEPFARAILHLRRAEWYDAIGEHAAAERERRWHENSDFEGWLWGPIQAAEVDWVVGAYVRVREGMRRIAEGDPAACADLRRVVDTLWADVEPDVARLRDDGRAKASSCP